MLLRFAAFAFLGSAVIASVSQPTFAGASPQVLLAQGQPAVQPQNAEANISALHQRLQITPAQESQFNAVANAMRENARAEASAPQRPAPGASAGCGAPSAPRAGGGCPCAGCTARTR